MSFGKTGKEQEVAGSRDDEAKEVGSPKSDLFGPSRSQEAEKESSSTKEEEKKSE